MSEAAAVSAGAMLRAAREQRGLHIAALAAAIKVAPRKLDALENDRWDELPDATFVRALAQTVCRTLKIDAAPVLGLLPPAGAAALEGAGGGLNMPFQDRPGREATGLAVAAIRPMVWAAGLLMLAAVAVYFLPASLWGPRPAPESKTLVSAVPPASTAAEAAPASAVAGVPPGSAASAAPQASTASAAPAPSASEGVALAGAPAASAAAPAQPVAVPAASAPASSPSAQVAGLLQLRASQATWIDVRDSRGQVLLSRTVQAGESVALDGIPPLRAVIGNAVATQLALRGQPVDLAPYTRDNVARLELH